MQRKVRWLFVRRSEWGRGGLPLSSCVLRKRQKGCGVRSTLMNKHDTEIHSVLEVDKRLKEKDGLKEEVKVVAEVCKKKKTSGENGVNGRK